MIIRMFVLGCLFALGLHAEMVYYFPFDNGTSASLSNYGTYGGFATPTNKYSSAYYPVSLATNTLLRTPFVERFPTSGGSEGGYLKISDSADKLRFIGPDNNPTGALTISTWVNWKGHDGLASHIDSCILSTMEGQMNTGFRFIINQGGELVFVFCRTPNNHNGGSGFRIPSNEWIHVTLRWKGSYPQTSLVSTNAILSTYNNWSGSGTTATNNSPIRIGAMDSINGYRPLNGLLDELAVWDDYLSDAQIKTLYSVPATLPAGHTAGDAWLNPTTQKAYIQLGASTGLEGVPPSAGTRIRFY